MRIGTWNIQTGLARNWSAVEALDVDVIAVQECEASTEDFVASVDGWGSAWQVGRYEKGSAVLARAPYEIETVEQAEPCWVSALIAGPARFRFVGFWAMTPTTDRDGYPEQATSLIERIPADGVPTVLAGDFNASYRNDRHLKNVESLNALGLVSAYHAHNDVVHGVQEAQPTSFHQWQPTKPFHMDYAFVPAAWKIDAVEIGTLDDYSRPGGISDHVPVVVEVSF